jgi:hypothetical protein
MRLEEMRALGERFKTQGKDGSKHKEKTQNNPLAVA